MIPSGIPDADEDNRGLLSHLAQVIGGLKTFMAVVVASAGLQLASLFNTNGTVAASVVLKLGTTASNGSVNSTARLAQLTTGIGGTEVARGWFTTAGQSDGFQMFGTALASLTMNSTVGIQLAYGTGGSLILDSNKFHLSGSGLTIQSNSNSQLTCASKPFFIYAAGASGVTETIRLVSQRADAGLKSVVAGTENATPNATAVLFQVAKGIGTSANDAGNGTAVGLQVFGDGHTKARATLALNEDGLARPTASAAYRGTIWYSKSISGVADTVEICLKSAGDAYSWVTLATG